MLSAKEYNDHMRLQKVNMVNGNLTVLLIIQDYTESMLFVK